MVFKYSDEGMKQLFSKYHTRLSTEEITHRVVWNKNTQCNQRTSCIVVVQPAIHILIRRKITSGKIWHDVQFGFAVVYNERPTHAFKWNKWKLLRPDNDRAAKIPPDIQRTDGFVRITFIERVAHAGNEILCSSAFWTLDHQYFPFVAFGY